MGQGLRVGRWTLDEWDACEGDQSPLYEILIEVLKPLCCRGKLYSKYKTRSLAMNLTSRQGNLVG